jgi:tetratricopeptide (TPR) repeat protein
MPAPLPGISRSAALCCLAAILALAPAASHAQAVKTISELVEEADKARAAGNWEQALKGYSAALDSAPGAKEPRYGVLWFLKGVCELKLKQWDAAMTSFQTCNEKFANTKESQANRFEKMALLRWGEAAMGAGQWQLALEKFEKFLKERNPRRDKFGQGLYHASLAVCFYRLGRFPEGSLNFETALKNRTNFETPDDSVALAFQALVETAIEKKNEQVILEFIGKNRGDVGMEPYIMQRYAGMLMKLGADCINAGMERAGIAVYQLVPESVAAAEELRAKIKQIGPRAGVEDGHRPLDRARMEKDLSRIETEMKGGRSIEAGRLMATAFIHERNGNIRGAYACYLQLERQHKASERREDNLYHLVRTCSVVGSAVDTEKYGRLFLETFPTSKHVPQVKRLMLSSLFYDGEYEQCLQVAEPMIGQLKEGTDEHDICLHVLGGSYFYTGQFAKAQPLLDKHVELYPKSRFAQAAQYFQASNLSRLQEWNKSAELLDAFLAAHPDPGSNVYLPFALYDRAQCHYALDQNPPALEKLTRVLTEFPNCDVVDQSHILRGNIHSLEKRKAEAEADYLKALDFAERREHRMVAGEALYSLTALIGDPAEAKPENPRMKEAVAHADRFWKEYADGSPYQSRMAVAQLPPMRAVGRGKEALDKLQGVISSLAKGTDTSDMEAALGSFTEAYLEENSPEKLKELYYNFPGVTSSDRAARALLRVAVIGVFEDVLAKAGKDEAKKRKAESDIKVLFQELKTDFKVEDLTNYILVRLGDYLRLKTSTPRESLPYYDEALSREDRSYRFEALGGRADVNASSGDPAKTKDAIKDFEAVLADSQERNQKDFALYRIIVSLARLNDHDGVEKRANEYLDPKGHAFSARAPEVSLLLAQSFDKRNLSEDAIAMYVKVWGSNQGRISTSAPSILRWMELLWDRNKPAPDKFGKGDRQSAYEAGAKFIEATSRFKDKITEQDLPLWKKVEEKVKVYEADPSIKSLEEIRREQED